LVNLNLLHLYLVPPLGLTQSEFRPDPWHQQTSVLGYRMALFAWCCI